MLISWLGIDRHTSQFLSGSPLPCLFPQPHIHLLWHKLHKLIWQRNQFILPLSKGTFIYLFGIQATALHLPIPLQVIELAC